MKCCPANGLYKRTLHGAMVFRTAWIEHVELCKEYVNFCTIRLHYMVRQCRSGRHAFLVG